MDEFQNFSKYIESIEDQALPYGIMKIIPPPGEQFDTVIHHSLRQALNDYVDFPVQQSGSQEQRRMTKQMYGIISKSRMRETFLNFGSKSLEKIIADSNA